MKRWRQALALKWIWWRHCWPFHWAHKPGCDAYRGEVFRLGRLRLCRGCTLLYGGLIVIFLLSLLGGDALPMRMQAGIFLLTLAVSIGSAPTLYLRVPRWQRDLLRFLAGGVMGLWTAQFFHGVWLIPSTALLLMAIAAYAYRGSRFRHKQQICAACTESQHGGICSGYQSQAECIRHYEEAATGWLEAQERMPECLVGKRDGL